MKMNATALLQRAVLKGADLKIITRLLTTRGADPNAVDAAGETVLHHAVRTNNSQLVFILLSHGAAPNQPDKKGITPLMAALNAKKFNNAALVIDHSGNINFQPAAKDLPPLYYAIALDATEGHTDRTAFALEKGALAYAATTPDDGSSLCMTVWALRHDQRAGNEKFTDLFKRYVRDFDAIQTGERQHQARVQALYANARANGQKYKMRP